MHITFKRIIIPAFKKAACVILILLALLMISKGIVATQRFFQATSLTPATLARLLFDSGAPLVTSSGRTNVLLMGIAGGDHAGADLTDTMIVLSAQNDPSTASMISLPRDIWSPTLVDKINSAYHYGEEKKVGGGLLLSKVIAEEVVGFPIQYGLVVDFSGFQDVIDLVGGVDVDVSNAFADDEFPIRGREDDFCDGDPQYRCRYETVSFEKGLQHMDGTRALIYVRSRKAIGDEGSDFARTRRQQEVLVALKAKLMSPSMLLHPRLFMQLYRVFMSTTQTDMTLGELLTVAKQIYRIPGQEVTRISLDGELVTAPSSWYGRYALVPKVDIKTLHSYIQEQLHQ